MLEDCNMVCLILSSQSLSLQQLPVLLYYYMMALDVINVPPHQHSCDIMEPIKANALCG